MKRILYIKRGTFITEQGFIQAFLTFFVCIGIPVFVTNLYDDSYSFIKFADEAFSSLLTSIYFIIMIAAPIIAVLLVIFGSIYDYFSFKKDPQRIKAISLYDGYVCLHCNKKMYDKILKYGEIKYVMFSNRKAKVINPNTTSKGFKLGGVGLATAVASSSSSEVTYEVDMSIVDKNANEYTITIPPKFSNNPYKEIEKVKIFFRKNNINVRDKIKM